MTTKISTRPCLAGESPIAACETLHEDNSRDRVGGRVVGALAFVTIVMVSGTALAVTPVDGEPLDLFPVTINAGSGDQYDPHVSGNMASYTDATKVQYFDFTSISNTLIPTTATAQDLLSDVSNGRIVFSRVDLDGRIPVLVYDIAGGTTTEISPVSAPIRFGSSIGGDTIAFIDYGLSAEGEFMIATVGGTATRMTTDTRFDQSPSMSQLGDVVVWESCATGQPNCDIRQASKVAGTWVVKALTNNAEPEGSPHTDGTYVAYDATRSGVRDIFWQPVGGGAETQLSLQGEQRNPSVSGGVMLFESVAVGETAADLYLYEISTNRLFRITQTVGTDESLSDIAKQGDGSFRIVWSSNPSWTLERDVYGASFVLPPTQPPSFTFGGFLQPVDPLPALNSMKAGGAVPVKFSVGGYFGTGIFAAGYPKSQTVTCSSTAPELGIETTVTAGGSSLSYDATLDQYTYVWKTDKAWAGTCRQLVLGFSDGTFFRANFKFK